MSERQSYPLNFRQLEEKYTRPNAPFADGYSTRYSEIIKLFARRMNRDEAIKFLSEHQPLPPDRLLRRHLIERYDEVRRYFLAHPDPETIPLFINSFGAGGGFGVYQLIEDVLRCHPSAIVIPHLVDALKSRSGGVAYWSAEISAIFPDPRLVEPLISILNDGPEDARYPALTALEQIDDPRIVPALIEARERNADPGIEDLIADILEKRQSEQDGTSNGG